MPGPSLGRREGQGQASGLGTQDEQDGHQALSNEDGKGHPEQQPVMLPMRLIIHRYRP